MFRFRKINLISPMLVSRLVIQPIHTYKIHFRYPRVTLGILFFLLMILILAAMPISAMQSQLP